MFYKQTVITFIAVFFLLHGYAKEGNDSVVAIIKSTALSRADLNAFCQAQNYDSATLLLALKANIYEPENQGCGTDIPVYPRLKFSFSQITNSLQKEGTLNSLVAYTSALYKLIAEPMKLGNQAACCKKIDYMNRSLCCANLFDSLSTGAWAFDCGGHAEMAKVFLDSLAGNEYVTKTVQLERKNGDEVNHIVTLVYFRKNNLWYGIALDCQNGKLGPVKSDSILSVAEEEIALRLNEADSLKIISIPEPELHKKRNLMNDAFYCNVLPDDSNEYHLAYPVSGYKYERQTYSALHYTWFNAGFLNLKKYEYNLLNLLVKNAPPN